MAPEVHVEVEALEVPEDMDREVQEGEDDRELQDHRDHQDTMNRVRMDTDRRHHQGIIIRDRQEGEHPLVQRLRHFSLY